MEMVCHRGCDVCETREKFRFCRIGVMKEEGGVFYTMKKERCAIYLTLLGKRMRDVG